MTTTHTLTHKIAYLYYKFMHGIGWRVREKTRGKVTRTFQSKIGNFPNFSSFFFYFVYFWVQKPMPWNIRRKGRKYSNCRNSRKLKIKQIKIYSNIYSIVLLFWSSGMCAVACIACNWYFMHLIPPPPHVNIDLSWLHWTTVWPNRHHHTHTGGVCAPLNSELEIFGVNRWPSKHAHTLTHHSPTYNISWFQTLNLSERVHIGWPELEIEF